jgi:hypothetical protein
MPVTLISLAEFLSQYDAALRWLNSHGVRTQGTRLAVYRRNIARAEHDEARGRFDHKQRPELLNALIEASEIIEIAQIDEAHLAGGDVLEKLSRISGGPPTMAPEGSDSARDYAFEFHTAAVLQQQGEFGGFSRQDGDLTVATECYPAECKRVSSLDSLRNRLRDGRDKLSRLARDGSPPGVITLDLTRPVRMVHGPIVAASDEQFMEEAERRLIAYLPEHVMTVRNIGSLACPPVLGVIVRCLSAGTVGEDANIRRSIVWHACSVHSDESAENSLFRRVARGFGSGELREGTRDELVDAIARIDVIPNRRR